MKKLLLVSALLFSANTMADDTSTTANANDPCTIVMCMAAKVSGNSGGSDCDAAQRVFFSTIGKKHHVFNPAKTLTKRKNLLGQCPDGKDQAEKILSKFGRLKG
ncbi:hypothetical protein [Rosenbergiella nectarea]|uniref:hypothetical protein n=1 Tax=Rosenbergiella nectarea TaxID=988801 RepID=UPI001F4EB85C|nr:hypothetical protein [Rosenbergiella nectarea]